MHSWLSQQENAGRLFSEGAATRTVSAQQAPRAATVLSRLGGQCAAYRAPHRDRRLPLRSSGRISASRPLRQASSGSQYSSLQLNAALSCEDENDLAPGDRCAAPMRLPAFVVQHPTPMRRWMRRSARSRDCWRGRRRARSLSAPLGKRIPIAPLVRTANESCHLRPLLLGEPARRLTYQARRS
jgi:hypothetical protein